MAQVKYDPDKHKFVLDGGEVIDNLQILNVDSRVESIPITTFGSSAPVATLKGEITTTISTLYEEPDVSNWKKEVEKIDRAAIRKQSKEIVDGFKR